MAEINWLRFPFYHSTEHLPNDDPRRCGAFDLTPQVLALLNTPVLVPTVEPGAAELAIVKARYPDCDPADPPWMQIKADLLLQGVAADTIHNAASLILVRMLATQPGGGDYYVTMLQMAAVGGSSKRTIRRMYDAGELPPPDVEGGGGKANQWRWSCVRPILENRFRRSLPMTFPADQFVRSG